MNNQKQNEDVAQTIIRECEELFNNRGTWEGHWKEIAERMIPAQSDLFTGGGGIGAKKTSFIFDSTAPVALTRFGSILDSLLTPRNQTWHRLAPSDPTLAKDRQTRLWFESVNQILFDYRYTATANFSSQNQQNYLSLGAFGTGCLFIDRLIGSYGLRYKNVHLSEVSFRENHQGIVDAAYRWFSMTARQIIQRWPNTAPQIIKDKVEKQPDANFDIYHCVKPQENYDPSRRDYRGMLFSDHYVCKEDNTVLAEDGYHTFPYAISRYTQTSGEIYGRSPAMDILPAVKTLNEQKKTILKQGHRIVDPVLLAHDDGVVNGFSLKPGAINTGGVNADGRALVQALPTGNLSIGKELMDDERSIINDAFLITIFQILTENPQMTATEVLERTREKGILLAPTIGRQQTEYLGPMIDRELDLLAQQRLLPPMPQMLLQAQGKYRIVYDSPISRAQRAEEAAGALRAVQQSMELAVQLQRPELLDYYNFDVMTPEVADIYATPTRWLNSADAIQKIRDARGKAAQTQQTVNAAPAAASLIKATKPVNQ